MLANTTASIAPEALGQQTREGLVGNLHAPHAFHVLLSLLLLVQQLLLSALIHGVVVRQHVLLVRAYGLPGQNLRTHRRLNLNFEQLPGKYLPQPRHPRLAAPRRLVPVDQTREGVHALAVY